MTGRNPMTYRVVPSVACVLLVVALVGCSLDVGGTEFHVVGPGGFMDPEMQEAMLFTATGQPVDDVVCDRGSVTIGRIESSDGTVIPGEGWAGMVDVAMAQEGVAEASFFPVFECEDGSGGFSMKVHTRFDFSTFDFTGEHDVGRWEIETGTGPYADLSGSGDVTLDWDRNDVKLDGDVR